jgi:hypothetical protein
MNKTDMGAPFAEFANLYLQQPKRHDLYCKRCKVASDMNTWGVVGTCSDGCCDNMRCPACGRGSFFERAD